MLDKILKIEGDSFHKVIRILGMRISIRKNKKNNHCKIERWFLWQNLERMTTKEKIWYLSQRFFEKVGYFPDFRHPKTFNEKLNWMKLNYYNPIENTIIDKYEFKNYIKEKLGEGYTIPLIGVYDDVNDIDFASLPQKFVIKTTTNGGAYGVKIIKDKSDLDINFIKYKFNDMLQDWNKTYYSIMARGCKEITPRIIIEEYIEQLDGQLYDYKFHCFHGEPKIILSIKDRKHGKYRFGFYDTEWNYINLHRGNPKLMVDIEKPKHFDKMLEISKQLSKDFPFVRVDFYEVGDKIYVGEMTFTPKGGFGKFSPREWDNKMGEWLDLNKIPSEYLHILPEFK